MAPTQAEGPCGYTLWSCDWLSHSVLNLPQKTDPREGDPPLTEVSVPYLR